MMSASPPPMMEDDDLDEDLSYEDELDLSDVPDFVPGDIGDDEEQDVTGGYGRSLWDYNDSWSLFLNRHVE